MSLRAFRQSRVKLLGACLAGVAFVAVGVWFIGHPRVSRYPSAFVEAVGWMGAALGGFGLLAGLVLLTRPATVLMEPQGLTIQSVWWKYNRPWTAISNARIKSFGGTKLVMFDDWTPSHSMLRRMTGPRRSLPAYLSAEPDTVVEEFNRAKRDWDSPPAAATE